MDSLNETAPEAPMTVIIIGTLPADSETPASEFIQFAEDNFGPGEYKVIFSTGTKKVNIETQA